MTRNQIEYRKLVELERANRAQESLTGTRDTRTLGLKEQELAEVAQHNRRSEEVALGNLNVARNQLELTAFDNTSKRMSAEANVRNAETNALNAQTNVRNAEINEYNAQSNRMSAGANVRNAESNALNAQSNYQNAQTNVAQLVELNRHNQVSEGISQFQADTARSRASTQNILDASSTALNRTKVTTEEAQQSRLESRAALERAQTLKSENDIRLANQSNARSWIETVPKTINMWKGVFSHEKAK
jgi:hypothetical protein